MIKKIRIRPEEMRRIRRDAKAVNESAEQYILRAIKFRRWINRTVYFASKRGESILEVKPIDFYHEGGELWAEVEDTFDGDFMEVQVKHLHEDKEDAERELKKYLQK